MWSEHRFLSFDETPIFYRMLKPAREPKALAIVLHGMGEHGGRYSNLAEYLAARDIECFVPDLRGFGKSGGRRGCVRFFSDYHQDLGAFHGWIDRTRRKIPIFIVGHSFGGLVASSYLAFNETPRITGLVLSSPIFGIYYQVALWRHILALAISYIFPDYSQSSRVKSSVLTHDQEILAAYKEDRLIYHRITARLYRELVRMIGKKIEIASRLKLPVLILQAGEDFIVKKEETVRFYEALQSSNKELEIYPGFYHEIFNEKDRLKVFSRVAQWFSAQS